VKFRLGHRPALDGIRAIAILAVMAAHYRRSQLAFPTRGGFLGVDVFFVLSGFLITSLLCEEWIKTGAIRLRLFYARRALRLLPAFFTMVAVYLVWAATLGPRQYLHKELVEALTAVLYSENLFRAFMTHHASPPPANGLVPAWTLSAEEQFYVLWPFILILLVRFRGLRAASVFAALLFSAQAIFRGFNYHHHWHQFAFTRPDSLLVGCLLALLLAQGVSWRPPIWLGWAAVAGVVLGLTCAVYTAEYLLAYGFPLFALACGLSLWTVVTRADWAVTRLLELRPLVGIGRISYGLYLWQLPVFCAIEKYVAHIRLLAPLAVFFTFVVALISYRFVEMPFLRLKGKLSPVRQAQPAPPLEAPAIAAPAT
jgi:peptidoglycan/LPS O-acetylase OafA/YrhL